MNLNDWIEATDREGRRLGDVAASSLESPVPACPDWTMADLVGHIGMVHRLASHAISTGAMPEKRARPPEAELVIDWYGEGLGRLLDLFAHADPTAQAWNWSVAEPVAGFWWRRMAHETAVHRWDAEGAVGEPGAIEPRLASDGIDEWFDVHVRSRSRDPGLGDAADAGSLHVHCTDVDGEWWARLPGRDLELAREHRKGDVVLRGNASDLLLVLWGRQPASLVETMGDADLLAFWL